MNIVCIINGLHALISGSTRRAKSRAENAHGNDAGKHRAEPRGTDALMTNATQINASNASAEIHTYQRFDALIDALMTRWKTDRQRVVPLSARSMALRGFRCPASDALMVSPPVRGNALCPSRATGLTPRTAKRTAGAMKAERPLTLDIREAARERA